MKNSQTSFTELTCNVFTITPYMAYDQDQRAINDDVFSINTQFFARIALLSKQKKWVLFSGATPLPTVKELQTYNIDAKKVIKIKSSKNMTDKDIILKALLANNASAIIADDTLESTDKSEILNQATKSDCEVFFMKSDVRGTLERKSINYDA